MAKTIGRKLLAVCLGFMVVLQMIPGSLTTSYADDAGSDAGKSFDLGQLIQTLEIKGNPESVAHGDKVTVKFGWTVDGETYKDAEKFTYQLPVNFHIPNATAGKITRGENGKSIGSYHVDTNGLITITYDGGYNAQNQTTVNYMEITGNAQFGKDQNNHQIEFKWGSGTKIVKVTNPGDFTVDKTAKKTYPNGLSDNSVIEYTVVINTENGTNGTFTIKDTMDTLNDARGNCFGANDAVKFDSSSFVLKDNAGKTIPVKANVDGKSFTIENVPALAAGGSYTLTYKAQVSIENQNINKNKYVNNVVSATSGGVTKSDKTRVTYGEILTKYMSKYEAPQNRMRWATYLRPNGQNFAGYTFSDTAEAELVGSVTVQAWKGGTVLQNAKPDVKISEDKKTFSFVFPDVEGVEYWSMSYYTKGEAGSGEEITTKNTATLTSENKKEAWVATVTGKGVGTGTTKVNKESAGLVKNDDGTVSLHWKTSTTYEGVKPAGGVYKITDTIGNAEVRQRTTNSLGHSWDYWNTTNGKDHYGVAPEMLQQIKDSIRITVKNGDKEEVLSYAQARERVSSGVYVIFAKEGTFSSGISGDDAKTPVKYFQVQVKEALNPVKVEFNYDTRYDTKNYSEGAIWRMVNKISSEGIEQTKEVQYTESVKETGGISKQIMTGTNMFTSSDYTVDYDKVKGQLTFRLLATPDKDASTLHVSDTLPEGFELVEGSVKVGGFYQGGNVINNNWVGNSNVTVTYPSEGNNTLDVFVQSIGDKLKLRDANTVVIQYTVSVNKDFEQMDGAKVENQESGFTTSRAFTNTAINHTEGGDVKDSLKTTVVRQKTVLDKSGEQVKQNGAGTKVVHYSVSINPDALDLLKDSDELTLTDKITSNDLDFKLLPTSIKLYAADAEGNKGAEVDPLGVHIQQPTTSTSAAGVETTEQSFEIRVKDGTAYILEYDYMADMRDGKNAATEGKLSNSIELAGYVSASDETDLSGINVRASSNHAGLQLMKVDSKNNARFLTATFMLEKYDGSNWTFVKNVTMDGEDGFLFDYYKKSEVLEGNTLYRITETQAPTGYKLDPTPFHFIIKGNIQDVRTGTIEATNLVIASDETAKKAANAPLGLDIHMLNPSESSYFEITNEKAPIQFSLEGTKTLSGRDLKDGEFQFTVTEEVGESGEAADADRTTGESESADGNRTTGEKIVATGTNDADGTINFSAMEYTLADVGTHTYIITEDAGDLGGVTYDTTRFQVKVTVSEDETTGALKVTPEYPEGGVAFQNSYNAEEAVANLAAQKNYTGATLQDQQFNFQLKDADGEVLETVANDAEGNIAFTQLHYTEAGQFHYTISEVAGTEKGVTYDDTIYNVTVTVTDNGEGQLVAEVAYDAEEVVFNNKYTEPKKEREVVEDHEEDGPDDDPSDDVDDDDSKKKVVKKHTSRESNSNGSYVQTGDTTNFAPWVSLMAIAALGLAAVFVKRRKGE